LAHVRILHAIRVAPGDLQVFIKGDARAKAKCKLDEVAGSSGDESCAAAKGFEAFLFAQKRCRERGERPSPWIWACSGSEATGLISMKCPVGPTSWWLAAAR